MNCPGHYSRFDCESGGQQVWGQATQNLPQYALRVDDKGDIYAEGVDELFYGRLSNVLVRESIMAYKRQIDRLPIVPKDAKEFNVTCHFCIVGCGYKAYTWPANKQGGTAPGQNKFGVDLAQAATGRDARVVRALDVQHRPPERRRRSYRRQAGQGLRREFGPRLGARRAHGRDELLAAAQHPVAAPDRPVGLALRADAADRLGRRARSGRARDRRRHQRHGRGRLVRFRLRSWRRRRRLREHLGHRQALFRSDEGQEHPHS